MSKIKLLKTNVINYKSNLHHKTQELISNKFVIYFIQYAHSDSINSFVFEHVALQKDPDSLVQERAQAFDALVLLMIELETFSLLYL